MLNRDSGKVIDILKELTLGTDSETCIKFIKCGRKAMPELQALYDGTSEEARRKQVARTDLKKIFYNNENTFTFEKYVTKLKGIFNMLENVVFHSTRIRWLSIYYTILCHQTQS